MRAPTAREFLAVRDVSVRFGGIHALQGVCLTVSEGEIRGIIGPNGAGKTTLFNVLTGVQEPNSGSVLLDGAELVGRTPETICRRGVARTYQKVRPFPRLTVLQNVMIPIVNRTGWTGGIKAARPLALDMIERAGLGAYAHTDAGALNLFHRKKVELARALAAGGRLLLLDEVMAGLTPVECDSAVALLRSIKDEFKLTIVCIEHLMRIVMALSDHITVLDRGRVIAEGTPTAVSSNAQVQEAYFGSDHA
jgi:branched-chain amino acid transport system ATP-binding protein